MFVASSVVWSPPRHLLFKARVPFCHYSSLDFSHSLSYFIGFILKQCTAFYTLQESLLKEAALGPHFTELRPEVWSSGSPQLTGLNGFWNAWDVLTTFCFILCVVLSNPVALPPSDWPALLLLSVVLSQLGSAENRPEQSPPQQRLQLSSALQQQQQQLQVISNFTLLQTLCSKSTHSTSRSFILLSFQTVS